MLVQRRELFFLERGKAPWPAAAGRHPAARWKRPSPGVRPPGRARASAAGACARREADVIALARNGIDASETAWSLRGRDGCRSRDRPLVQPVHVAAGMRPRRALDRGGGPAPKEPQREVREPRAWLGVAPAARRASLRAAAIASACAPRWRPCCGRRECSRSTVVSSSRLLWPCGELCRMRRRDRAAQACISPSDRAIALSRQATSQWLERTGCAPCPCTRRTASCVTPRS